MDGFKRPTRQESAKILADLVERKPAPPGPLHELPCACSIPIRKWHCPKPGSLFCANCRLVAYCSKECQKHHWPTHRADCKHPVRSKNWQPGWIPEDRRPLFEEGQGGPKPQFTGIPLWASIPAMDLLNLPENQGGDGSLNNGLNVAVPAFCDLRDIMMTVNSLPENYSGTLNFVINDEHTAVVARNVVLLLLLSGTTLLAGSPIDADLAAEVALHFWASSHVPPASDLRLVVTIHNFIGAAFEAANGPVFRSKTQEINVDVPLSEKSRLRGSLPGIFFSSLSSWSQGDPDPKAIEQEMKTTRYSRETSDDFDQHYSKLEPSHRMSWENYRRKGLVLPFGAPTDQFYVPNRLLFSPQGEWIQNGDSNPLDSWDIESVVKMGKAHGASREDLFGCLYFYLFEAFHKFALRLRQFSLNFEFYNLAPSDLSQRLKARATEPSTASPLSPHQFDRIHVAYLIDRNTDSGKMSQALGEWAPLLKPVKQSTITGDFQFWGKVQKGASVATLPPEVTVDILMQYVKDGKITNHASVAPKTAEEIAGYTMAYYGTLDAAVENSAAFRDYLKRIGLQDALAKNKLSWKVVHTILPYRLGVLPEKPNTLRSLPSFLPDREEWYLNTCVASHSWTLRFIELSWDG